MRFLLVLAVLLLALPARAVELEFVDVGDAGNPCDRRNPEVCFGAVAYDFGIGKYEVTNAQYGEFLNSVDPEGANPLGLYNALMGDDPINGGIQLSGAGDPGAKYVVKGGFEEKPVIYVSFFDAARFANWLQNRRGSGDTESGAYEITSFAVSSNTVVRGAGTRYAVTSQAEWYKAAYYTGRGDRYFNYPASRDRKMVCAAPSTDANRANCGNVVESVTDVGAYSGSPGPYGTFDQGGNVWEWTDDACSLEGDPCRVQLGGDFYAKAEFIRYLAFPPPLTEDEYSGFRVVRVPEPGHAVLLLSGGLVLAASRPARRRKPPTAPTLSGPAPSG